MEGFLFLFGIAGAFVFAVIVAKMHSRTQELERRVEELDDAAHRESQAARTAFWYLEQRVQTLERQLQERRERALALGEPFDAAQGSQATSETPPAQAQPSTPPDLATEPPEPAPVKPSEHDFVWPMGEAASEVRPRAAFSEALERVVHPAAPSLKQLEPAAPEREPVDQSGADEHEHEAVQEPTRAPAPSSESEPRISWEQWLGVRGAAALGAVVSVVAGIFFFKYGIEHGLITPALRVATGFATGGLLVSGADLFVRPRHRALGAWLTGAGIAILYTAVWAMSVLYALASIGVGFALMCMITALCGALAIVRGSLPIAGLGLIGGFATPALLSTGEDRPVALFSYLFVLDAALLWVARSRRWVSLAIFSLVGTIGYEAAWIVGRMPPERIALGLVILVVFGALFSIVTGSDDDRRQWSGLRIAGLCVPVVFGLGMSLELGLERSSIYFFGPFVVVVVLAAVWGGHRDGTQWLGPFGLVGALATLLAWATTRLVLTPIEWFWTASLTAVAVLPVLPRVAPPEAARLGLWSTLGALGVLTDIAAQCRFEIWPLEITALGLAALALGVAVRRPGAVWPIVAALGSMLVLLVIRGGRAAQDAAIALECVLLGAAVAVAAVARTFRRATEGSGLRRAAFVLALAALIHWTWSEPHALVAPWSSALLVAEVALGCAAASELSGVYLGGVLGAATVTLLVLFARPTGIEVGSLPWLDARAAPLGLVCAACTLVCVASSPFVVRRLRDEAHAWRAASAAPLVLFPALLIGYRELYGRATQGAVAGVLAVVALSILIGVRRVGPRNGEVKRTATIWAAACATALLTCAVPLQLDREWITIGWALEAVALLALWRRFDHAGLLYWALGLSAAVTVRLVANPAVADYHVESALPLVNWISYTYLIPAVCLITAWYMIRDLEIERRRIWEGQFLPRNSAALSRSCVTAAIVVVFVWVNLSVVSWYAPAHRLVFSLSNVWARDLTMSIAWAAYALALLAIGMWRASTALRVASLCLILGTSLKVFLYDLSHLEDLYRVASLVGLALSLVAISVAYQRLVFRRGLD